MGLISCDAELLAVADCPFRPVVKLSLGLGRLLYGLNEYQYQPPPACQTNSHVQRMLTYPGGRKYSVGLPI
jgi:hypothetical protein